MTPNDSSILAARGISEETVNSQLQRFATGFPSLRLQGSATVGNGIVAPDAFACANATGRWSRYLADGGEVTKFVPASGAASRMFKSLFAFVNDGNPEPKPGSDVDKLLAHIDYLPFIDALNASLVEQTGKTAQELIDEGRKIEVVSAIVKTPGLGYGSLPKGLLQFHKYTDGSVRTPLHEQLAEGAQTAATDGKVKLHFTVSPEHRDMFIRMAREAAEQLSPVYGVDYEISFSEQKPSTDTIAANPDNTPFRDDEGKLVFRPGGHGALIHNLSDIDSTVVFIKNIDNVVPDWRRQPTVEYKRVIAGILLEVHDNIDFYLRRLRSGEATSEQLAEIHEFVNSALCVTADNAVIEAAGGLTAWLIKVLDRPLRVCGMVRNEGEPGGGPYLAYNPDGSASPQILESSQIDTSNPEAAAMMASATHFNPVDLVCYLRDIDGNRYDLTRFVDPDTGFISHKSFAGRELKALELPGLWNGAMSGWNTVFVEVPVATFNPVKTVNDLLRPAHQPE